MAIPSPPSDASRHREILDAALALADERGLDAVSMRTVAARVGVTAMALYPHVASKDALLDGIVGRILAELRAAAAPGSADWRDRMRLAAHAVRDVARAHPSAFGLLFARPAVTADGVRTVDLVYTALLDAGVPPQQVARLERLASTFVLGFAMSEINGRFSAGTDNVRARRDQTGPVDLPGHAAILEWLEQPVDWDAEFDADLDDLIALIERAAR